jgi:hypothetical protein
MFFAYFVAKHLHSIRKVVGDETFSKRPGQEVTTRSASSAQQTNERKPLHCPKKSAS